MESERRKVYVEVNVTHRLMGQQDRIPLNLKIMKDMKLTVLSKNAVLHRQKSVEQVFDIRCRFAGNPHFCSTRKTESGLSKQNPKMRRIF